MLLATMQFAPVFGDPAANMEKIRQLANETQAHLYVLPELCTTGYQFADREEALALAEWIPGGRSVAALCEIAAQTDSILCAGLAERDGDTLFNSAVVLDSGGILLLYRKTHLFQDEKELFEPGDLGAISALYECYAGGFEGTTLRDTSYWRGQLAYSGAPEQDFRIALEGDRPVAYARRVWLGAPLAMEILPPSSCRTTLRAPAESHAIVTRPFCRSLAPN